MLSKLLKYEFKATGRTYGGLYLAILAAAALLGISFRIPALLVHTAPIAVLMIVYMALVVAVVVMTILTIIQRFTRNLLGREGYLMHTLPVSSVQLILSKLLSSMVWVLCSILVVALSFVVFSLFGSISSSAPRMPPTKSMRASALGFSMPNTGARTRSCRMDTSSPFTASPLFTLFFAVRRNQE